MADLCVAGLPIRVQCADGAFFCPRFSEYRREDDTTPELDVVSRVMEMIPEPTGETVLANGNSVVHHLQDGRFCRFCRTKKENSIPFAFYFSPDHACVEIQIKRDCRNARLSCTDLEYMLTGAAFKNRLAYLGGGVLHGSAITWRGHGIAFSADSGVGKSTQTKLWKERFGEDVVILNDDKPALLMEKDAVWVWGTPWSGKTALHCNRRAPLEAIVFIRRGKENHIRRIDVLEGLCLLTRQIERPYYDAALGIKLLDFTQRLAEMIPMYELTCDISQKAVETAFRAIFPREEDVLCK